MSGLKWIRVESSFATNPKILSLVEAKAFRAVSVYVFALGYSGQHGTDGFIPQTALPFIHGTKKDAQQLVEAHLWIPSMGGWDINGWADFQPSTQEQKDRRSRAKAAAEIRWHGRAHGA